MVTSASKNDDLLVRDLITVALRGWWVIAAVTILAVILVSIWMSVVEPKYTAQMTIAPASSDLPQDLGALSAVASFAGLNPVIPEAVPKYVRFRQTLISTGLADRLEERHKVLHKVFEKRWDAAGETWLPPGGPFDRAKAVVNPLFGLPAWTEPSSETLVEFIKEEVAVAEIADTSMLTLSFSHEDREFAVALLTWLHNEADSLLREEARDIALRQISYATKRLSSITVSDYRNMMLALLAEEEKKLLLIEAAGPYAALIVDTPRVSTEPTFPKPVIFLIAAIVLGIAFGTVLVFGWHAFFAPIHQGVAFESTVGSVEVAGTKRDAPTESEPRKGSE